MKKSDKLFWIVSLALLAFIGIRQLQAADGIDPRQAQQMVQQGALLIDVREPEEYAAGHAPNAKLIPLGQIGSRLPELASYKDKPIVVMCRSGRRSAQAASQLREAGFNQVNNLKGGINAWQGDGLEVVRM